MCYADFKKAGEKECLWRNIRLSREARLNTGFIDKENIMNELSEIFKAAHNGDRIVLENKIYEIAPEDGFHLKGLFFSNTAKYEENPDGERFCAVYLEEKLVRR